MKKELYTRMSRGSDPDRMIKRVILVTKSSLCVRWNCKAIIYYAALGQKRPKLANRKDMCFIGATPGFICPENPDVSSTILVGDVHMGPPQSANLALSD